MSKWCFVMKRRPKLVDMTVEVNLVFLRILRTNVAATKAQISKSNLRRCYDKKCQIGHDSPFLKRMEARVLEPDTIFSLLLYFNLLTFSIRQCRTKPHILGTFIVYHSCTFTHKFKFIHSLKLHIHAPRRSKGRRPLGAREWTQRWIIAEINMDGYGVARWLSASSARQRLSAYWQPTRWVSAQPHSR